MSKILKSFCIVTLTSCLSSLVILAILYSSSREVLSSKRGDEKLNVDSDSASSTTTQTQIQPVFEWINHVFPFFVGVDMTLPAMVNEILSLNHKFAIAFLIFMLMLMEGLCRVKLFETASNAKVLTINHISSYGLHFLVYKHIIIISNVSSKVIVTGILTLNAVLLLVMAVHGPMALYLESLKLNSVLFMWGNFKLMVKIEILRLILKQFLSGHSRLPMSKEEMFKSVVKRHKEYLDYMVYETNQLAIGPFVTWIIGLLLHALLSETSYLFDYNFTPDLHMSLPNSGFLKNLLIILFELDHMLMLNSILKLSWMSGIVLIIITFIVQFRDVFKSSTGSRVECLEVLQDILGIDVNQAKLCRVFINITVCAVTPWIVRILIGFGHYFLWDTFGGTSSSIFWFGQIYLHLYCIAARLRIFAHLICFGLPSSWTKDSCRFFDDTDNEQFKVWEDYLKMPNI
ncbi:unnamed protein product [Orchesella dallaii]|uniref:Uncharacterized protein n=1 Tax=Orchesella dallaii TaxID=48710 RepID=A0ABP1RFX5_9HEXA